MEIRHQPAGPGAAIVSLSGKVMLGTGTERITELVGELVDQGTKIVVFDLGGVTSLDSTGVGQFIASFNRIVAAGGQMRMAAAAGYILQTFHVSRLDRMFPFYASAEEAVKA
jgi:anti-sigma B factor antagonist